MNKQSLELERGPSFEALEPRLLLSSAVVEPVDVSIEPVTSAVYAAGPDQQSATNSANLTDLLGKVPAKPVTLSFNLVDPYNANDVDRVTMSGQVIAVGPDGVIRNGDTSQLVGFAVRDKGSVYVVNRGGGDGITEFTEGGQILGKNVKSITFRGSVDGSPNIKADNLGGLVVLGDADLDLKTRSLDRVYIKGSLTDSDLYVTGDLGVLTVKGPVEASQLNVDGDSKTVRVGSVIDCYYGFNNLGSFITSNFKNSTLEVNNDGDLGVLVVKGFLDRSEIKVDGGSRAVTIGHAVNSSLELDSVRSLVVSGNANMDLEAHSIGKAYIRGSLMDSDWHVASDLGVFTVKGFAERSHVKVGGNSRAVTIGHAVNSSFGFGGNVNYFRAINDFDGSYLDVNHRLTRGVIQGTFYDSWMDAGQIGQLYLKDAVNSGVLADKIDVLVARDLFNFGAWAVYDMGRVTIRRNIGGDQQTKIGTIDERDEFLLRLPGRSLKITHQTPYRAGLFYAAVGLEPPCE